MLPTAPSSFPSSPTARPRAFTLIEILVVVAILVLLIAILVPALAAAKATAKKSATTATLANLQTALNAYFSDFNLYPPSSNTPSVYSAIPAARGPAMLAEALMGYLPGGISTVAGSGDGAGPDAANPAFANDPRLGFRTRPTALNGTAYGKIYGPYATDDPKSFRFNNSTNTDASFLDSYGNEILYYRATGNAASTTLSAVFAPAGNRALFNADDNLAFYKPDLSSYSILNTAPAAAPNNFFALLNAPANAITSPGTILGNASFLLLSQGPDATPFSSDDIPATNR